MSARLRPKQPCAQLPLHPQFYVLTPPPHHHLQQPPQLTGHFHAGGAVWANGIHYVTYEGLVEAPPESNSYAIVEVSDTQISIRGGGYGATRELKIRAPGSTAPREP